ncbi:hypothetical protein H0H92_010004 [Tricholoma furcatifolium]|nr:hypothetical protein H0H92_010004 [Tricholoma furcatifolium]
MPPMKLAIIGGGPSAFYVASRLLSLAPESPLRIHIFDRLWAPHGLNCTHKFDAAATDPRLQFFGNVNVGQSESQIEHTVHVPLPSIFENYTHVLFATGCPFPRHHRALPQSAHCIPALSFVHWYTQHPSHTHIPPPPLERTKHVSLIGNGNVALDVARMLLTPPSHLSTYDVPQPVLDVLARSAVKHVSIFARRGPREAAFTAKEVRELINLPDSAMVPIPQDILDVPYKQPPTRQQGRILQLLKQGSKNPFGSTPKTWSLDFFRDPIELVSNGGESAKLMLAHTKVDQDTGRAVQTDVRESVTTDLVVPSLGFQADPVSPFCDSALTHMRTSPGGRVVNIVQGNQGNVLKNVYASGWAATGAKGVLAATMMDAYAVADAVLSDLLPATTEVHTTVVPETRGVQPSTTQGEETMVLNANPHPSDPPAEVLKGLQDGVVTVYGDWKRVDEEEVRRGKAMGKERERMEWKEAKIFLANIPPKIDQGDVTDAPSGPPPTKKHRRSSSADLTPVELDKVEHGLNGIQKQIEELLRWKDLEEIHCIQLSKVDREILHSKLGVHDEGTIPASDPKDFLSCILGVLEGNSNLKTRAFDKLTAAVKDWDPSHLLGVLSLHNTNINDKASSRIIIDAWVLSGMQLLTNLDTVSILFPELLIWSSRLSSDQPAEINHNTEIVYLAGSVDYGVVNIHPPKNLPARQMKDYKQRLVKGVNAVRAIQLYTPFNTTTTIHEAKREERSLTDHEPQVVAQCLAIGAKLKRTVQKPEEHMGLDSSKIGFTLTSGVVWVFGLVDTQDKRFWRTEEFNTAGLWNEDLNSQAQSLRALMSLLLIWGTQPVETLEAVMKSLKPSVNCS